MHSKLKGNIGELFVAADLAKKGFHVFKELGDLSKIDLIAVKDDKLLRIQVKARQYENGIVSLQLKKSGPNYSFKYKKEQFDYFAVYVLGKDCVLYIKSDILDSNSTQLNIRFDKAKNNNQTTVNLYTDYLNIELPSSETLRDQSLDNKDYDKVQTTKDLNLANEN